MTKYEFENHDWNETYRIMESTGIIEIETTYDLVKLIKIDTPYEFVKTICNKVDSYEKIMEVLTEYEEEANDSVCCLDFSGAYRLYFNGYRDAYWYIVEKIK